MTETSSPDLRPGRTLAGEGNQLRPQGSCWRSRRVAPWAGTITGEICFHWISDEFKAKGITYRDLAVLAQLGYLQTTREGRYAVYYRIVGPDHDLGHTRRELPLLVTSVILGYPLWTRGSPS